MRSAQYDHLQNVCIQGASRGIGLALVGRMLQRPSVGHVIATARRPEASEGLFALTQRHPDRLITLTVDVTDEGSMAEAARISTARVGRLHLLMNVAGLLHAPDGMAPEKRIEALDPGFLARAFAVNATGPALMVKHMLPLLRHDERAVIANLSARVGSIEDNGLGGWYGYRASKAAQNQLTRTLAIELRRRAKHVICVALHPGTVDTALSRPFRGGAKRRFTPDEAAGHLLDVIDGLGPEDTGAFFAWDGSRIPW
ncbi:MAG: SDR family oxidoreductase [Bradymonadia bacterium]